MSTISIVGCQSSQTLQVPTQCPKQMMEVFYRMTLPAFPKTNKKILDELSIACPKSEPEKCIVLRKFLNDIALFAVNLEIFRKEVLKDV